MDIVYNIILLIIFIILIKIVIDYNCYIYIENYGKDEKNLYILQKDVKYYDKFSKSNILSKLINNNFLQQPIIKKNKILFITYDNRYEEQYIKIHNYNITKYVEKFDYTYKFFNRCDKNVYWCKIYMVLDELKKNIYDYVIWLDSDTIIKNFNIDIGTILNSYSSDIFFGSDNNIRYDLINSGVFIIKNSTIGINFLENCINNMHHNCLDDNNNLRGKWAATCYEQGTMNLLVADKYSKNTTILSNDIIFNFNVCSDDVFIMHLYASPSQNRISCFQSNNPAI